MAKAGKQPWDAGFRQIRAAFRPEWLYPPRTTATDLDMAERELDFKFPASYRAFAEQFGLGGELHSLPELLPLFPPAKKTAWFHSVVAATHFFHTFDWGQYRTPTPMTFLKRVIVFAVDGGYHTFVFDPLEVTNARLRECRIYDLNRQHEASAIATSFNGWLAWIDENYRFEEEDVGEQQEPTFPLVFKPNSTVPQPMLYWRRPLQGRKKPPAKRDLKRWLTWNDGTVRKLAESIRAEGRTEALPILADALEEAGCTNAQFLHWCRHGDPDIDGAWVLWVLLRGR
jgi:hypothetical protein